MTTPLSTEQRASTGDFHAHARYRAFGEQTAVGVVETDASGRFLLVNQEFCAMTGYTESELLGMHFQEITHPADLPFNVATIEQLLVDGRPYSFEKRYRRKDGGEIWVYVCVTRVEPQPGEEATVLAVVLDISERRRAERAALLSEQRYRMLFNSIDTGFCVIEVLFGADGRPEDFVFLELNAPFERLTGLANVHGRRMRELVPAHEQSWFDIFGQVVVSGEPIRFEQEARALHRWYNVYAFRFGDPRDCRVGVLFEDITSRRASEQRRLFLADLADRMAPLRDDGEIMEIATSALGRFMRVDRCFFVECLETENRVVIAVDYARHGLPHVAGEMTLFEFGGIEWWREYAAGNFAVTDVAAHPLTRERAAAYQRFDVGSYLVQPFKREGEWTTVLAVADVEPRAWCAEDAKLVEDVVARVWSLVERARSDRALRQAHAQLERRVAERTARLQETISELESYSYSISHDLRAPLRAMQTYASIVAEEFAAQLPGEGHEYLRRIMTAGERMDRLIQDVLVVSRLSRGNMPMERIELGAFICAVIDTYPGLHVSTAQIDLVSPLGAVRANPAALTQCVSNLLGNAIKFVASGVKPHVRIWTESRGDRRRIFFQDNGIGIPPEAHEKIFGMFYQMDQTKEGTGVGLAVVRKAVERMGGKAGVTSSPGAGSTFWIELEDATGNASL